MVPNIEKFAIQQTVLEQTAVVLNGSLIYKLRIVKGDV